MLWGVSMGASTAILAAKQCPPFAAIIADSSFLSFRETVSHHLKLIFHLPSFPISNLIVAVTAVRMGINPNDGDVEARRKFDRELGIVRPSLRSPHAARCKSDEWSREIAQLIMQQIIRCLIIAHRRIQLWPRTLGRGRMFALCQPPQSFRVMPIGAVLYDV